MTTYYVSSLIGSNPNAGTSSTTPLASLQAAANLVKPGDTVEVMHRPIPVRFTGTLVDITTSGTASAPITFEAAPGQTPVIDSSGCWSGIHVFFSTLTSRASPSSATPRAITWCSATAGYSCGSSQLDGNGITVTVDHRGSFAQPCHDREQHSLRRRRRRHRHRGSRRCPDPQQRRLQQRKLVGIRMQRHFRHDIAEFWIRRLEPTSSSAATSPTTTPSLFPLNGAGVVEDGEGIILDTKLNYTSEIQVTQHRLRQRQLVHPF